MCFCIEKAIRVLFTDTRHRADRKFEVQNSNIFGSAIITLHKKTCSLDIRAGVTLLLASMILDEWKTVLYELSSRCSGKRQKDHCLWTRKFYCTFFLWSSQIWFRFVLNLEIDILLGTHFIDLFICVICTAKNHLTVPPSTSRYS